ncbi:MAG TPA: BON domain-containing protein [Vicinamibacterales bacterium]|nr:BON domain-containing protein [Vicinamibacterales bacterium]
MKIRMTSLGLPAALLAASLFGACSNTAKGVQEDTAQNAEKAKEASAEAAAATERAAEDAKVKMDNAAEATKAGAETAAEATKDAAKNTANTADGAQQTMQIKTALLADKSVDASSIDVDTNGMTKTVTLKGHVPNAAQKASAERIAKSKAPDYTVVNNLTVG